MTLEEARRVAEVCRIADHNCSTCIEELVSALSLRFPEFSWQMVEREWGDPDGGYNEHGWYDIEVRDV